jgi:hypothetical protein
MGDLGRSKGSISEKKVRNLGNGRRKKNVRTEAVPFPKPKYENKSRFRFWKRYKEGPDVSFFSCSEKA